MRKEQQAAIEQLESKLTEERKQYDRDLRSELSRIARAAGTESIEDILLMIRNGKRHVECVRKQTHAEPIRASNDEVAKRISGK